MALPVVPKVPPFPSNWGVPAVPAVPVPPPVDFPQVPDYPFNSPPPPPPPAAAQPTPVLESDIQQQPVKVPPEQTLQQPPPQQQPNPTASSPPDPAITSPVPAEQDQPPVPSSKPFAIVPTTRPDRPGSTDNVAPGPTASPTDDPSRTPSSTFDTSARTSSSTTGISPAKTTAASGQNGGNSHLPPAKIVGAVLGGLFGLILLLLLALFLLRRYKKKQRGVHHLPDDVDSGGVPPIGHAHTRSISASAMAFASSIPRALSKRGHSKSDPEKTVATQSSFHKVSGHKLPSLFVDSEYDHDDTKSLGIRASTLESPTRLYSPSTTLIGMSTSEPTHSIPSSRITSQDMRGVGVGVVAAGTGGALPYTFFNPHPEHDGSAEMLMPSPARLPVVSRPSSNAPSRPESALISPPPLFLPGTSNLTPRARSPFVPSVGPDTTNTSFVGTPGLNSPPLGTSRSGTPARGSVGARLPGQNFPNGSRGSRFTEDIR